jgi:DNA methylase
MLGKKSKKLGALFLEAARYQGPVKGVTHNLYKYPARFSPVFARATIECFSSPGDVVLDPFVGGGTAMIEARLVGRNALGSDISSLAVFLTRAKAEPLIKSELGTIADWFISVPGRLNIHHPAKNLRSGSFEGYDRNMPWRLRKLCEQYLSTLDELPSDRHQRFARCVLLRCGQWAMDCRKTIPTVEDFRAMLEVTLQNSIAAMNEYRGALDSCNFNGTARPVFRCVQSSAGNLTFATFGRSFPSKVDLLLTSPPYPGVHVLYHRWNVRGRRESPAPFWLANCFDGHGSVHYMLGDRRQDELTNYFSGIEAAYRNLYSMLADSGLVVQLVAFASPDWQLRAYLQAMKNAGFKEVMPKALGIKCPGRLWRSVPGRKWYSMMRGEIPTSNEVVLFHRKAS